MTTPQPPPPQDGTQRELQAAATAAELAAVYAAAEAAILAAVAAGVATVVRAQIITNAVKRLVARKIARHVAIILAAARHHADRTVSKAGVAGPPPPPPKLPRQTPPPQRDITPGIPQGDWAPGAAPPAPGSPQRQRLTAEPPKPQQHKRRSVEDILDGASRHAQASALDAYRQAVSDAIDATRGGLPAVNISYSAMQAAQKALDKLSDQGLTGYVDRSGRHWSLPAYVEMATRTEISHRLDDLMTGRLAASGIDAVWTYTDSTQGSCRRCLPWLGKVLSVSGTSSYASVLLASGAQFSRPVSGTLDEAKAAGFRHPGCRCSFTGLWDGINLGQLGNSAVPPGQQAQAYEASQKQRALERQVRAAGRAAAVAVTAQGKRQARRHLAAVSAASAQHRASAGVIQTKVDVRRRESPSGPPGGPAQ